MDNKYIKDGIGNLFYVRMKDISAGGDGSLMRSSIFASMSPPDYGTGGMYQHSARSGVIGSTGSPALVKAPIYQFYYPGTLGAPFLLASIRRVRLSAWATNVFAAGFASFDVYAARNIVAQDSGGNTSDLTGNNSKLATAMNASLATVRWANTAVLSAGTRTLDAAPLDGQTIVAPTTANTSFGPRLILFEKQQSDYPLLLNGHEGFIVAASLPAGGPWSFDITTEWEELATF